MTYKITVLPGDGIGPEIVREAVKVLKALDKGFEFEEALIGGASIDAYGLPIREEVLDLAKKGDAVLLGAVGGPKWEDLDYSIRPERALLALRKELGAFGNLRPAKVFLPLVDASPLKREIVEGVDLIVVRELTGGIYFGEPRGVEKTSDGREKGVNTLIYYDYEIERIARLAFGVATKRRGKVTSVDKANVLESAELWRKVVTRVHREFEGVELNHMYVDNCAMQLVLDPKQFDVILTTNMFGDILSDEAAMLTGSIGMLPSASLGGKVGIFEPIHGSAPDIAGQNRANPLATILSAAMMLRFAFDMEKEACAIEEAVERVLERGYRTPDIFSEGNEMVSCSEMGDRVVEALEEVLERA